jgi:hypothetical protein
MFASSFLLYHDNVRTTPPERSRPPRAADAAAQHALRARQNDNERAARAANAGPPLLARLRRLPVLSILRQAIAQTVAGLSA